MAYELMNLSAKELSDHLATGKPGSARHGEILTEIQRRQLFLQYEAVEVQKRAALAEEKAAEATVVVAGAVEQNAKYILWAVIAATASAAISLLTTIITVWPRK